jgi:hypothetical protein
MKPPLKKTLFFFSAMPRRGLAKVLASASEALGCLDITIVERQDVVDGLWVHF